MDVENLFKNVPKLFDRKHLNKDINEAILIHQGSLSLRFPYDTIAKTLDNWNITLEEQIGKTLKDVTISAFNQTYLELKFKQGEIQFDWHPCPRMVLEIKYSDEENVLEYFLGQESVDVFVCDKLLGTIPILFGSSTISHLGRQGVFQGVVQEKEIEDDDNKLVQKIEFSITNLPFSYGEITQNEDNGKLRSKRNRLRFSISNGVEMVIDGRYDLKDKILKDLKNASGHCITHHGYMNFESGMTIDEARNVLNTLRFCLSFFAGSHIGMVFIEFYDENTSIDSQISYHTKFRPYKDVIKPICDDPWVNSRFLEQMHEIRKTEDDEQALSDLLHWYIEANSNQGHTEGSLILAQVGIELLWNWILFDKLKMITKNDGERISAASKIQMLCTYIGINLDENQISDDFHKFSKSKKMSVSEAVVNLRNRQVHSTKSKRESLKSYSQNIVDEAREILLAIIDRYILNIGNYEEGRNYWNRLKRTYEPFHPTLKEFDFNEMIQSQNE